MDNIARGCQHRTENKTPQKPVIDTQGIGQQKELQVQEELSQHTSSTMYIYIKQGCSITLIQRPAFHTNTQQGTSSQNITISSVI